MRWQGLRALDRLRASVETGGDPVGPIAHGALILVAGMLLVLPGFFTDFLGLLLLVPPVRDLLIRLGASRMTVRAATYVRRRRPGEGPGGRRRRSRRTTRWSSPAPAPGAAPAGPGHS